MQASFPSGWALYQLLSMTENTKFVVIKKVQAYCTLMENHREGSLLIFGLFTSTLCQKLENSNDSVLCYCPACNVP